MSDAPSNTTVSLVFSEHAGMTKVSVDAQTNTRVCVACCLFRWFVVLFRCLLCVVLFV